MFYRFGVVVLNIIFSIFVLSLAWGQNAEASDNTQKLKQHYQSYQTAVKNGEYRLALVAADDAWKTSEDTLGHAKQTGDFAYIYAALGQQLTGNKRNKRVEKAFERSLELANLHGEKTAKHTIMRQLRYGVYWTQIGKRKKGNAQLEAAEQLAQSSGLTTNKTYATLLHVKSKLAFERKQYATAETAAVLALQIMENLDLAETRIGYEMLYSRALVQLKLKQWPEAIDGFGKISANVDRVLPKAHRFIGRAYFLESRAVQQYDKANNLDYNEITDIGNCRGCWPNFDPKYTANLSLRMKYNVERHPPVMPKYAHGSGVVALMYDTDDAGKPVNIRIIERSSARAFDRPSIEAVEKWNITDKQTGLPAKRAKDLVTIMTFQLTDQTGKLLDFYGKAIEN